MSSRKARLAAFAWGCVIAFVIPSPWRWITLGVTVAVILAWPVRKSDAS